MSKPIPDTRAAKLESQLDGAMALHQQGQLARAQAIYKDILKTQPGHCDALHFLGVIAIQTGEHRVAINLIGQAIDINPNNPGFYSNRGIALHKLKKLESAVASFDQAIALEPNFAVAHNNRGNALMELKQFEAALASYDQAIATKPDYAEAYYHRANALTELGQLESAVADYDQAIARRQDHAESYNNRGNALIKLKQFRVAIASFDKGIAIKPDFAEAYYNRANALKELKELDAAVANYDQAVAVKTDFSYAYNNRGNALIELKRLDEALLSYRKAIEHKPDYGDAYLNIATTCAQKGQFDSASRSIKTYFELSLGSGSTRENSIRILQQFFSADTLPAIYKSEQELTSARAHTSETFAGLAKALSTHEKVDPNLSEGVRMLAFLINGFYIAYQQCNDVAIMRDYARCLSFGFQEGLILIENRRRKSGKIRIGIASERLCNNNGARWAYNWLSQLPADYDFFTYSFSAFRDEVHSRFARLGTHRELSFERDHFKSTLATMVEDDLDILMLPDVGMSTSSRILSLHRIAPIQFTAWGHPSTTGSPNMDYYLSSDLMEPVDAQLHYSETLIRMPNLALFLEPSAEIEQKYKTFGLPDDRILFGCLQSLFKYLPRYDHIFPRIAEEVPNSLFIFLEGDPAYTTEILKDRLIAAFADHRLDSSKYVTFVPRVSFEEYRMLVSNMDVMIDSIGWSGGNSSLEAIELGVPLVTLPGEFMRGRHTHGMFEMMGLRELSANSCDDYIQKLVSLGRDRAARKFVRSRFLKRKYALYEDFKFINQFDLFLKNEFQRCLR